MEKRRRREWDEHVTTMDALRFVKISRDNTSAESTSPAHYKKMSRLHPWLKQAEWTTTKRKKIKYVECCYFMSKLYYKAINNSKNGYENNSQCTYLIT